MKKRRCKQIRTKIFKIYNCLLVSVMLIDFVMFTDKGERSINEDFVCEAHSDGNYVFVLADGLGGHGGGDVASKLVAETITSLFKNNCSDNFIDKCFIEAQKSLLEHQKCQYASTSMKTTTVVLYIKDNKINYGHIGDSRLYFIKKGKIISRTLDHSVPQMLVLSGEIKEKDIRHHEDRNRLLRCMGNEWDDTCPKYQIDVQDLQAAKGMNFLLCSDGFWEWITEKEIQKILKKRISAKEQVEKMCETVLKNGKGKNMDNYSVILVKVKGV